MTRKVVRSLCVLLLATGSAFAQLVITKPPNSGEIAHLSPTGAYVYASSFLNSASEDTVPTVLGMWLRVSPAPAPPVRFEIWSEATGGGPDASAVLATTGTLSLPVTGSLTFFSAPVTGTPSALTAGVRYWFVATCVGETGPGAYSVGGHAQNSVYPDNGTFWLSHDPAGVIFSGNSRPEMAFEVTLERLAAEAIPVAGPRGIALLIVMVALAGALLIKRA